MSAPMISFVQFERCELCRRNHTQKWKHVYSKKHQEIVKNILIKFKKKVKAATEDLYLPHVEPENWEVGARCWCYFCRQECEKHDRVGNVTLRNSGFLQHLAETEHKTNAEKFWKEHRIEDKKMNGFLLEEQQIKRYQARAEEVIQKYLDKVARETTQKAAELYYKAELRSRLVQHVRYETYAQTQMTKEMKSEQRKGKTDDQRNIVFTQPTRADLGPVRTVAAHGEGLTCIKIPSEKDASITGNVHSGAMPPWMLDDSDSDRIAEDNKVIGPSQADFDKHLELERKRKLPATRVGAKFDHKSATSATWLPSFGRVWNNQRRTNSRQQFEKSEWKMGRKGPPSATITKAQYDATQNNPGSSTISAERQIAPEHRHSYLTDVPSSAEQSSSTTSVESGAVPRVHPYRRKESSVPSQVQMPSHSQNHHNGNTFQHTNNTGYQANNVNYHGYNGYSNNLHRSSGNGGNANNNPSKGSTPNTQRPAFQKIKLSSKFLK